MSFRHDIVFINVVINVFCIFATNKSTCILHVEGECSDRKEILFTIYSYFTQTNLILKSGNPELTFLEK